MNRTEWLAHGRRTYGGALALGALWLIVFPLYTHSLYWQGVLFLCFLYAIMASGWNIISGFAGYVSLGQSAFMGLGAYTTALLTLHLHVSAWCRSAASSQRSSQACSGL
jgi:ABC-type branched-subunit amino acid transport system permease subunit